MFFSRLVSLHRMCPACCSCSLQILIKDPRFTMAQEIDGIICIHSAADTESYSIWLHSLLLVLPDAINVTQIAFDSPRKNTRTFWALMSH
jgi:hypothetical protein